jgi:hypothetical protein
MFPSPPTNLVSALCRIPPDKRRVAGGDRFVLAQAFMDDRPQPIAAGSSEAAQRLMRTIIISF